MVEQFRAGDRVKIGAAGFADGIGIVIHKRSSYSSGADYDVVVIESDARRARPILSYSFEACELELIPRPTKGLAVQVYRSPLGDSTNKGASSRHSIFVLTGYDIPEISEPSSELPELCLIESFATSERMYRAVPRALADSGAWVTFGGNFAYSSDSRLGFVNHGAPVKIFDRVE